MFLSIRLKEVRERRKYTQTQLAELISDENAKVSNRTISNWEQEISQPDIDMIGRLCKVLDIDANYLFGWDEIKKEENKVIVSSPSAVDADKKIVLFDDNGNIKKTDTYIRLNEIMKEQNLKQVDILKKLEPISKETGVKIEGNELSRYVSGSVKPSQQKLSILAKALEVNELWLLGYDVPKNKKELREFRNYLVHYNDFQYYNHFLVILDRVLKKYDEEDIKDADLEKLLEFAFSSKDFIIKKDTKKQNKKDNNELKQ